VRLFSKPLRRRCPHCNQRLGEWVDLADGRADQCRPRWRAAGRHHLPDTIAARVGAAGAVMLAAEAEDGGRRTDT